MCARTRLLFSLCCLALCARSPHALGDMQKPETLPQVEPVIAHDVQLGTDGTDENVLSYKEPQKRTLSCAHLAQNFLRAHGEHPSPESDPKLMLYFLHIPRTAGRTYHSCYLKLAHPPSRRCAKSYDELRLDKSISGCGLLSSHDDYSVIDLLPNNSALITQLREPVDRFLSAYEFATEVAARAARLGPATAPQHDPRRTNTRDVWPWSYLVPFMEKDIDERLAWAWQAATDNPRPDELMDPYNNEVIMPLAEFVEHPDVQDVLHNGATLQVLGLTNYSRWPGAADLRRCLHASPVAQELLLDAALKRLETFVHVGLFDRLFDSITSLAATLGMKLEGPSWEPTTEPQELSNTDPGWMELRLRNVSADHTRTSNGLEAARRSLEVKISAGENESALAKVEGNIISLRRRLTSIEQEQAMLRSHLFPDEPFQWQSSWDEAYEQKWPLWRSYHQCVDRARQRNTKRRQSSFKNLDLPDGRKVHFSHNDRANIDPAILARIREMNTMDSRLYEKGQKLLEAKMAQQAAMGVLEELPSKDDAKVQEMQKRDAAMHPPQKKPQTGGRHRGGSHQGLKGHPQAEAQPTAAQGGDVNLQKPAADHQELR